MKENQKPILQNLITGLLIAATVIAIESQYGYPVTQILTDGFFVAAMILLGIGGIMAARNAGCFDMMGYSMKSLLGTVIPGTRIGDPHERETFLDYKERKSEKRNSPAPMLIAGAIHMGICAVMLVIYVLTT